MGTTANGLPYPEPTDPIADGAVAIKNLATKVDARYAAGSIATTVTATGGLTPTIPFGQTFAAAPVVVAVMQIGSGAPDLTGYVQSRTTTGFVYRVMKAAAVAPAGEAVTIQWVAVG